MRAISSSPNATWRAISAEPTTDPADLVPGRVVCEDFKGFGGCFNELGWMALQRLNQSDRQETLSALFSVSDGCGFDYCRVPIGANDFAASWYSHSEVVGDLAM